MTMHFSRTIAMLSCALLLALSPQCFGIIGGYEPDPDDTKFDAIVGIGLTENMLCYMSMPPCPVNWGCPCAHTNHGSGTLIAPDLVLMAAHSGPSDYPCDIAYPDPCTFTARFRRRPDGKLSNPEDCSTYFDVPIVQFLRPCGIVDATVAVLAYPVTHIVPMALDLNIRVQPGDGLILGGWGRTEWGGTPPGKLILKNVPCLISQCGAAITFPLSTAIGDSGGAVMIESSGGLRLVGNIVSPGGATDIHYILGDSPAALRGDFNGDGIVAPDDLDLIEQNLGKCSNCDSCSYDRNFDCTIDHFELIVARLTMGQVCTGPCYADVTGNQSVGSEDLTTVLFQWGSCNCPTCLADIDQNGKVDPDDLMYLINHWGSCPGNGSIAQ